MLNQWAAAQREQRDLMIKAQGNEVISSSAAHDQHFFASEQSVSDANGQVPLQTSAEFVRTYDAQAHEIVDTISAAVNYAHAGLNWLSAESPDLEKVRQALNSIASAGNQAAEIVVRLRALMKKMPTTDGFPHP
jgi:hypothetical protein